MLALCPDTRTPAKKILVKSTGSAKLNPVTVCPIYNRQEPTNKNCSPIKMNSPRMIRYCRWFILLLAAYTCIGIGGLIIWNIIGHGPYISEQLIGSFICAAFILILASAFISMLRCPKCNGPYFTKSKSRHPFLGTIFPFRQCHCCNCDYDAFHPARPNLIQREPQR